MDGATIGRLMSRIPARVARQPSGTPFGPEADPVRRLAGYLQWMTPLTSLDKDEQRALGLLAPGARAVAAQEAEEEPAELQETAQP